MWETEEAEALPPAEQVGEDVSGQGECQAARQHAGGTPQQAGD